MVEGDRVNLAWGVTCPGGTCLGGVPAGGMYLPGGREYLSVRGPLMLLILLTWKVICHPHLHKCH